MTPAASKTATRFGGKPNGNAFHKFVWTQDLEEVIVTRKRVKRVNPNPNLVTNDGTMTVTGMFSKALFQAQNKITDPHASTYRNIVFTNDSRIKNRDDDFKFNPNSPPRKKKNHNMAMKYLLFKKHGTLRPVITAIKPRRLPLQISQIGSFDACQTAGFRSPRIGGAADQPAGSPTKELARNFRSMQPVPKNEGSENPFTPGRNRASSSASTNCYKSHKFNCHSLSCDVASAHP
ncbi:hypothetical protein M378DRAFT_15746 [Amanita muscaria Koide BX008]|uniref:Uncharacterized protein n=1 Tax=Amanita muscaria (strain Koide BX008) TaxID=946122 RepID=A0A0C2WPJ8_AMAMK|nr:hypothetical protein M378DRAFT_15746 [Amanita muscaria Koide BX008]